MPSEGVLHNVSVRSLVPSPDLSGARRGAEERIHPAMQARLRRKYRTFESEVVLTADVPTSFGTVRVSGRLDGLRRSEDGVVLYEIKPVPMPARRWLHDPTLQRARWQLQLYLDLTRYVSGWHSKAAGGGVLYLVDLSGKTAEEWVDSPPPGFLVKRLEAVLSETQSSHRWAAVSAAALDEWIDADSKQDRPVQQTAWTSLREHDASVSALLALPPGAGKTRLAIRYALRHAVSQELPLFWVTVKSRGRDEVLAELQRYARAGFSMRVLWKTSASRLCDCDHIEFCPKRERTLEYLFLNGLTRWRTIASWTPDHVAEFAEAHELCGYELSRQLELLADVVIADLNYFLDASTLRDRNAVVVFDEVQNLPERVLQYGRVYLLRADLIAAIRSLSASARHRYRSLHSPEFLGETEPDVDLNLWSALAAELRSSDFGQVQAKVQKIAALSERYPGNYAVQWYQRADGPGWVGTLVNPKVVLDDLWSNERITLALSGSLPGSASDAALIFPGLERFEVIGTEGHAQPPVAIVPLLEFSHPISLKDHEDATRILRAVREYYGQTVAVFGQNRASNQILSMNLHARGYTSLMDSDFTDDWLAARDISPDFMFISLGGNLAEAVNPPADLFSVGVVLAPGFRPPDIFDYLQRAARREEFVQDTRVPETVSRVVQAAGRLQRSPQDLKPVLLLNKSFARPEFLRSFPRGWYLRRPEELLFDNLKDAQTYLKGLRRAN